MEHEFVVAIPNDGLRLTRHGLAYAIHAIPSPIKRAFRGKISYSWAGEAHEENGQRWVLVRLRITIDWGARRL